MEFLLGHIPDHSIGRKQHESRITQMDVVGSQNDSAFIRNVFLAFIFGTIEKIGRQDTQSPPETIGSRIFSYILANKFFILFFDIHNNNDNTNADDLHAYIVKIDRKKRLPSLCP